MKPATEKVLFVPDTHAPYHDEVAWALMMDAARDFNPDVIVTMGDLADFYAVSSFSKDPSREYNLEGEVAVVNQLLDELDALGASRSVFLEGNHCDRLSRYLKDKAPELFTLVGVPQLFKLQDRGWEFYPYKSHANIGRLFVTHDVGKAGRNAAAQTLDVYQHSVVTGHSHRFATIVEGNALGEAAVSAQFGWLGDVDKVDYLHKVTASRNWALGFGTGVHDIESGAVFLTPHPIIRKDGKYSTALDGRIYTRSA